MNEEIINAFQQSTECVFKTMLGLDVTHGPARQCDRMTARHPVSGIIGLSGEMSGDVIVSFEERVATLATAALLGEEPDGLNDDVVDAVGELTNMIAGGAKGTLGRGDMQLALPTVILGAGHRIGFSSGIRPISIEFQSSWGAFCIDIGLTEADENGPRRTKALAEAI
ncbi:MAG: chemotaxis protein CheX [Pirellulaceae bacterium]